jgi:large subunit ribosomal protein L18
MTSKKPRTVLYRRRREQKTNYKQRLKLLASRKLRLVVRFTNQRVISQLIKFEEKGDKIVAGADSTALKKLGWDHSGKNFPAAYLTGLLIAKTAVKKGFTEAILDAGLKSPLKKSKTYAFLKGALDGGLNVPHGDDMFPTEERIMGKHIDDKIVSAFKTVKQKING